MQQVISIQTLLKPRIRHLRRLQPTVHHFETELCISSTTLFDWAKVMMRMPETSWKLEGFQQLSCSAWDQDANLDVVPWET
ncbi:MAG: hypothetical protein AAFV80_03275, partial [Bacteroidota bacterium]